MMKGPKFRGISYKIAMGHMSEQRYERAIKEFLQIPGYESDAQVCELMARCYLKLGQVAGAEKHVDLAILEYGKEENTEKVEKLKLEFKR